MEVELGNKYWKYKFDCRMGLFLFLMENGRNSCMMVRHVEHHVFLSNHSQKPPNNKKNKNLKSKIFI